MVSVLIWWLIRLPALFVAWLPGAAAEDALRKQELDGIIIADLDMHWNHCSRLNDS